MALLTPQQLKKLKEEREKEIQARIEQADNIQQHTSTTTTYKQDLDAALESYQDYITRRDVLGVTLHLFQHHQYQVHPALTG